MTRIDTLSYLCIAFSPAICIFVAFIAGDPLRIILFVLGAFFWLLSLLVSSLIWYAVYPLRDTLAFGLFISIALQELFRFIYYFVLKRAQRGLDKLSANGMHLTGVHSLKNARHMLAVVCGLGMGVMAALFMLINVLADFSEEGTIGFPSSIRNENVTTPLHSNGDYHFCLISTISSGFVLLAHVFWTIIAWDSCHRYGIDGSGIIGIVLVITSHYIMSTMSFFNEYGHYGISLPTQAIILLGNVAYAWWRMGGSCKQLKLICGFGGTIIVQVPTSNTVVVDDEEVDNGASSHRQNNN